MPRVILAVLVLAFSIYTAVDAIQTEDDKIRNLPKVVWVLVCLLFPVAGGVTWFIAGRPRESLLRRQPPPGPRGPDDDPDFLRGI